MTKPHNKITKIFKIVIKATIVLIINNSKIALLLIVVLPELCLGVAKEFCVLLSGC